MRRYGTRESRSDWSPTRNNIGKAVWLMSLARNAIVVVIGTTLAWILYQYGNVPFKLTGNVPISHYLFCKSSMVEYPSLLCQEKYSAW